MVDGMRVEDRPAALTSIYRSLLLSAPSVSADPCQLAGQLTGRLLTSRQKDVAGFLRRMREAKSDTWLCPLTPSLASADGALERLLLGHTASVKAVAIAPDGSRAVSGGDDSVIRVWNLRTGQLERELIGHTATIWRLAITPDGRYAISSSEDESLRIWNLADGRPEGQIDCGLALSLAIVPGTNDIVTTGWNPTTATMGVSLWSLSNRAKTKALDRDFVLVAPIPEGSRVLVAGFRGDIYCWDLRDGEIRAGLASPADSADAFALEVGPDGDLVWRGGWAGIQGWSLRNGRLRYDLPSDGFAVRAVRSTPDGRWVVSGDDQGIVTVWRASNGERQMTLRGHVGAVWSIAVAPDGSRAVTAGDDNSVRVWRLGEDAAADPTPPLRATNMAIDQAGSRLAYIRQTDWDESELVVRSLPDGKERILGSIRGRFVSGLAVTPDGGRVATGTLEEGIQVWTADGALVAAGLARDRALVGLCFGSDGKHLVAWDVGLEIRRWDLETSECEVILAGVRTTASLASHVAVAGDLRMLMLGSRTIRVLDLTTDRLSIDQEIPWAAFTDVAISRDGRLGAFATEEGEVQVWDLAQGTLAFRFPTGNWVWALEFDLDARLLITTHRDGSIRAWDLTSGRLQTTWQLEPGAVLLTDRIACGRERDGLRT